MSYLEFIKRALKGRSVLAASKQLGIPQKTLDVYTKGERLPGYKVAKLLADEAGVSEAEVFKMLVEEEEKIREKKRGKLTAVIATMFFAFVINLLTNNDVQAGVLSMKTSSAEQHRFYIM